MCLVKKTRTPAWRAASSTTPHPSVTCGAVGKLADDADLHVIDDQSDAIRVADVRQGVGDRRLPAVLHGAPFGGLAAAGRGGRAVVRLGDVDLGPEQALDGSGIISGMKHHSRKPALVSGKSSV